MAMKSFAELLAVLTAQKANLTTYQTQVGATVGDITQVTNMANNLTNVDVWCLQVDDYKKAAFAFKDQLVNGDPLDLVGPVPVAPTAPTLTVPLSGGMTRQQDLNRRWKAAPAYTEAIGEALGIGPVEGSISLAAPTIDVFAAESMFQFSVVVTGRGVADQWECFVRPVGATAWQSMGSRTGKSSDFTYVPDPATQADQPTPVQLQVRVQLKKNDANMNPPSDIALATVNP